MSIASLIAMCVSVLSWWLCVEILGTIGTILLLLASLMVGIGPDFLEKSISRHPISVIKACL